MRGRWIEVDRERLSRTLEQFEVIERRAVTEGLSFGEAMRMLAGARIAADGATGHADVDWSQTVAGPWLAETLAALRRPDSAFVDPGRSFRGTLRPYQQAGVQWLRLLAQLGLGACLADVQAPATAAMVGTAQRSIRVITSSIRASYLRASSGVWKARNCEISVPAAKARSPAPVMMRTRSEPSVGTVSQISATRSYMAKVKALRVCGRLKVIVPMPSATS